MITLQYGVYVSGPATGGLTPTAFPMDDQLRGLYTPSTTFRAVTTSLGAGFVPKYCWQWLNGTPFDTASTPGASRGQHMLDEPSKFPSVWALIMPLQFLAPLQQPFSLTGEVDFDEWD
jgi:hypothetical protein